ncbi:MAG: GNAT family N-acetyltransferase [Clostridiaceae bacterium]|nr:GNAT family N-acetyltransferase [Clostridiaceae bacterium]
MIIIKKANKKEEDKLFSCYKHCLSINNHNPSHEQFEYIIVLDGESILGFCEIQFKSTYFSEIKSIYIKKEERNQGLGDGVLRASLNYILKNNYKYALIEGNAYINNFLMKEGILLLKDVDMPSNIPKKFQNYDFHTYFFCDINLFFEKGCKHK